MQVTIKEFRTGRVKKVEKKMAGILIRLKKAEYVSETLPGKPETPVKIMISAPTELKELPVSAQSDEADKEPVADTDDDSPKKRGPGRPKKNTYETKVMTAED